MSSEGRPARRVALAPLLVAVAVLAGTLQAANLLHVARAHDCAVPGLACAEDASPWTGRDTSAYRAAARDIRANGLFGASWLKRIPGYPLVLIAGEAVSGDDAAALWLGVPLAALAAASVGWLAWWLTGSAAAALAAGLLFCVWPNTLQYGARLLTDGIHGALVVSAVAATVCWRESEKPAAAGASALLWMLAQSLRPTFFAVPLLLPLLLWKRQPSTRLSTRFRNLSLALWISGFLVPLTIVGANQLRHGAPLPPVACYAAPRLEAQLELARRPARERLPAVERALFAHFRERCMERYRVDPERQAARDRRFLVDHPVAALRSVAGEIADQLLYPSRPYAKPGMEPLYGGWPYPAAGERSPLLAGFWLATLAGLGVVARRQPAFALFVALAAGLVMLPAANAHLVGARMRFPVDLLALPVVVAFGAALGQRLWRLRDRARPSPPDAAR